MGQPADFNDIFNTLLSELTMDTAFEYVFPCIRGIQARREYYVSMCPLRLLPKVFLFDEDELVPELRAQRTLNKNRLPEMSRYILDNRDTYTFSAITASVDGDVRFEPIAKEGDGQRIGLLHISMSARMIINDGQHRRAAIEIALRDNPDIGDESIAVVFFMDTGLERSQQMFADLNRHAVRPSKSLGLLYDHRDDAVQLTKYVVLKSSVFKDFVEMERSTLSARSRKLFTLSAVHTGNNALLEDIVNGNLAEDAKIAISFWEEVNKYMPEWNLVRDGKITAGDVRRDFIHSHGIALQAIGIAGNALLKETKTKTKWKSAVKNMETINWSRSNAQIWEGGKNLPSLENALALSRVLSLSVNELFGEEEPKSELERLVSELPSEALDHLKAFLRIFGKGNGQETHG